MDSGTELTRFLIVPLVPFKEQIYIYIFPSDFLFPNIIFPGFHPGIGVYSLETNNLLVDGAYEALDNLVKDADFRPGRTGDQLAEGGGVPWNFSLAILRSVTIMFSGFYRFLFGCTIE